MKKCKEPIAYIVFGVLTTVVNIVVYFLLADLLEIHYMIANVIAWIASVLFAFVTNKLFVFESKSWRGKTALVEMGNFFLARAATGVLDMVLMWLLVDVVRIETIVVSGEMLAKVVVNVLVIVINYAASKLWIFRRKE